MTAKRIERENVPPNYDAAILKTYAVPGYELPPKGRIAIAFGGKRVFIHSLPVSQGFRVSDFNTGTTLDYIQNNEILFADDGSLIVGT